MLFDINSKLRLMLLHKEITRMKKRMLQAKEANSVAPY